MSKTPKKTNLYTQGSVSSQKKKSDKVKKDDVKGPRVEDVLNTVGSNDSPLSKKPLQFRLKVARSRDENSYRGPSDKDLVPMLKGEDTEGQLQSKVWQRLQRNLGASKLLSVEDLAAGITGVLEASQLPRPSDVQNRTLQDQLISQSPNTGFLTTIGLKAVLGNAQGAVTDLQHIGISSQGNANNGTLQQLQTPSKSVKKSEKKPFVVLGPSIMLVSNMIVTKTLSTSSKSAKKSSSKKTPDPRDLEQREKEILGTLMPYIDGLGDQAWKLIDTKTLGVIDTRQAEEELNRLAEKVSDQREVDLFAKSLESSEMAKAEKSLRDWTKAAKEDRNTNVQSHNRALEPVIASVKAKNSAIVALADLRKTQPSIQEQILQFRIRGHRALRTLHQAIQRSEWLNIIFDTAKTTIEVGAKRNRLHADICMQEASERTKFNLDLTYEETPVLAAMRTREETAIRKKLDSLGITMLSDRNKQVATVRTLTYRAMVKESEKYPNEEEARRRARIADRREELSRKVDEKRSAELVLERSKAAVEFVRSFELDGDRGQIAKKAAAKQKLIELNRAIETEFIVKPVSNSEPAQVLKDFSEEMSDQLLIPIFQAYATTKWLELRYQNTGPVTMDASFKRMEDLISDNPFSNRDILDPDELAELKVLETNFLARTNRAFAAVSLEACEGKHISAAAQERMRPPVTNLALVTSKLEAKELAKKKEATQKRLKEEADATNVRREQQMKDQLDAALHKSTEDLKIVRDQLLTLKNDLKQGFAPRQNLFPQDTVDGMLRDLNTEIERVDGKGLLTPRKAPPVSPRLSPRREELLSPTIGQTFLIGFLKPSMTHQGKLAKLEEIQDKLKETQPLLQAEINKLESEREGALKDAVASLKKVHAKLVTLKKPPYNKDRRYREGLMSGVVSGQDEELQPVFVKINRDNVLELDSSQMDEANLDLGNFDADQLRKIAESAALVEEELKDKIELTKEVQEDGLKKETTKALEKLNEVRSKLEELKGEPFVLDVTQRQDIYLPSFGTSDPETLRGLFRNVNTLYNYKPKFDEFFKDRVLGAALTSVEEEDLNTPHESKIAFLKKAQEKSDEIILLLNAKITRLKKERDDELDALIKRAVDEMAPLREMKKLLNNLGVADENLLDADLRGLTGRHDPSVEAVLSFYKEADLGKDGTEQAGETLKKAVAGQGTFAEKKTLLEKITPKVKAASEKLTKELDLAKAGKYKYSQGDAIRALGDVREKLIRLKNNHAVKFDVREGLMAPILADALSPPSIFTEINTNVGEPGVDEAKQDFVRLVTNAVKVDLSALVLTESEAIYARKIEFLGNLTEKATEVAKALNIEIESKLSEQQIARQRALDEGRDNLLKDFREIRGTLEALKEQHGEMVGQRGSLYTRIVEVSPTIQTILKDINDSVGEVGTNASADNAIRLLNEKIEKEKKEKHNDKDSPDPELLQHKSAIKWIKRATPIVDNVKKVLAGEIDRINSEIEREKERERERQRQMERERERERAQQMLRRQQEEEQLRALQIERASSIFDVSMEESIGALVRVHARLDRLKKDPYKKSPEEREVLFFASLPEEKPNFSSIFKNINAAVDVVDGRRDDQIVSEYLNSAIRIDVMQGLGLSEDRSEVHRQRMNFFANGATYCGDVKEKAIEIEGLLKAAELEELKDFAAASLVPLHAAKKELAALKVENLYELLDGLQRDGTNATNNLALDHVKEFYRACDATADLTEVAVEKPRIEANLGALGGAATFEEKEALLQAIQLKAADALGVLEGQKREKEAQNQSIENAVASLLALYQAKQGLVSPPNNLDRLREGDPLALEAVKKFYEEANETNGTEEKIKRYITDALASQGNAPSADKQKFLDAIPGIVAEALNTLKQSAKEREMNGLITAAANSLVPIHTAKARLAAFPPNDLKLLDTLENPDSEIAANEPALERVKNFYRNALVIDGSEKPDVQARESIREDKNMRDIAGLEDDGSFEEVKKFLKAIPPIAKLAARYLEEAAQTKEDAEKLRAVEILNTLAQGIATNLVLIDTAKKGLKQPDENLLDDLAPLDEEVQGQRAVNLVRQFYKDADVEEGAKEPKEQALDVLKGDVVNSALTFDEKQALFLTIEAVVKRAVEMLNKVKEAEELAELLEDAVNSLEPIHAAKKDLKNPDFDWLKDLASEDGEPAEAVELVKKFYRDAVVTEASKPKALEMLQAEVIEKEGLTPKDKKKLLEAVIDVAGRANVLLSEAKEVEERDDLSAAAIQSLIPIHTVKGELTSIRAYNRDLLKDLSGDNVLAVEMVRQFYQDLNVSEEAEEQARTSLQEFLLRESGNSDSETKKTSLRDVSAIAEEAETILRNALQQSKEYVQATTDITLKNKHAEEMEFLEALQRKAAEIEKNLQREIDTRKALETKERDALKSVGDLYDTMKSLQSSHGIDAPHRSALFPRVNSRNKKYEGVFDELNSSVGGSGDGSAKTAATKHSMQVGLKKISPSTTESLSDFYTSVKSRADEINAALERKLLLEQQRPSRSGGAMSKVEFFYPSFTPITYSTDEGRDEIYYPRAEGVTYTRCRPILHGVSGVQQTAIGDKFDFVTTLDPEDLLEADKVKSAINAIMAQANVPKAAEDEALTEKEMAIAILLSIRHGGILSDDTDTEAFIKDLIKVKNFGKGEDEKAVELYFRMAAFAEDFQALSVEKGFLTGNTYESKYAAKHKDEVLTGLRLKRLTPDYSRDLFTNGGGNISEWEGICKNIGLTVDVLCRPVGSVSEVASVSRPLSVTSQRSLN